MESTALHASRKHIAKRGARRKAVSTASNQLHATEPQCWKLAGNCTLLCEHQGWICCGTAHGRPCFKVQAHMSKLGNFSSTSSASSVLSLGRMLAWKAPWLSECCMLHQIVSGPVREGGCKTSLPPPHAWPSDSLNVAAMHLA